MVLGIQWNIDLCHQLNSNLNKMASYKNTMQKYIHNEACLA